jgi:hypothetical protein
MRVRLDPRGVRPARRNRPRTVAVLDRLACGPIRDPLIDSATIARAGGYVALTDAGGVERARLVVEPNVVDSQPVTHRLTLYPHTRFFDIEATQGVGTFDQERYQLIVRPPCPEEAFAQNVWLVRTSTGPIGDPIPGVSGTPGGAMRFNLEPPVPVRDLALTATPPFHLGHAAEVPAREEALPRSRMVIS